MLAVGRTSLPINGGSTENKRDELETCPQLQVYSLVGTEMRWDGSRDWGVAMEGRELLRKDQKSCPLRSAWSFSTEVEEEPAESWVRMKVRTGDGDVVVGICYRPGRTSS